MCPFRPDYIVETKNSYELVESVSGACRNQGEILEFDMKVGSNRTLAKNLARMFLKIVSEVDRKKEQGSDDPIRGEAPLRYLATVFKTHEGADIDTLFVTSVGKQWAIGFENEVLKDSGRRTNRHKTRISRQMIKDLFDV